MESVLFSGIKPSSEDVAIQCAFFFCVLIVPINYLLILYEICVKLFALSTSISHNKLSYLSEIIFLE